MSRTFGKVAFLGLGVMGYPMAGHLVRAGYDVTVYNRTQAKASRWVEQYKALGKASMAATPREAVRDCDVVFACVGGKHLCRSHDRLGRRRARDARCLCKKGHGVS